MGMPAALWPIVMSTMAAATMMKTVKKNMTIINRGKMM